ncbi:MAG TPA: alanyl-tRNA editing protein [bacterium]|nr:alanyl-tRNA editing protein [bacterium]
MPTILTYYDEPYLQETVARVVSIDPIDESHLRVVLDHSIFYPEGGGQPCDTGTIAGLAVDNVEERGDQVLHRVCAKIDEACAAGLATDALVPCMVRLKIRIDRSEQHTAQHLLSAVLLRMMDAHTLSFHLGDTWSSIDINLSSFDRADADIVEDEVLRIIRDGYAVITHRCPPEDPAWFPLRKEPAVEAQVLRIVEIDGIEYSACCGTHVPNTGAIGAFRIIRIEKFKGGTRIHFIAGGRAYNDYRRLAALARDSAAAGSMAEDALPVAIVGWRDRIKALERALSYADDRLASLEAAALDAATAVGSIVHASSESTDAGSRLARFLAARGRIAVVSCPAELRVVAASPSTGVAASSLDVGAILGPLAKANFGKGGGGKTFFQAAFQDQMSMEAFVDSLATL